MKSNNYDFRRFQEELAALDHKSVTPAKEKAAAKGKSAPARLVQAEAEFRVLRERYALTVADVVGFFPEEEGIAYLQALIAAQETKGKRRRPKSQD